MPTSVSRAEAGNCRNKPKSMMSLTVDEEKQLKADELFLEAIHEAYFAKSQEERDAAVATVEAALANKQDVNVGDEDGQSAVHRAVKGAASRNATDMKVLELLVANGAFIDYSDNYGKRPINVGIESAYKGSIVVEYLLKLTDKEGNRIVDLNFVRTVDKRSILHDCAWAGNTDVMKLLLAVKDANGASVMTPQLEFLDKMGKTCNMIAAFRAPKAMVELLIDAGADANATENNPRSLSKETAMDMAAKMGREDTAEYLSNLMVTIKAVGFAAKMKKSVK